MMEYCGIGFVRRMDYHIGMNNQDSPSALPRREREQAQHRQDILAAAVELFANHGYHQTTMQMIAERAEFSVGYLYKHFAGKEEIYQDLVRFHTGRIDELLAVVKAEQQPPLEQLRASLEAFAGHFNQHPSFMRVFHQEIGGAFCEMVESKQRHFDEIVALLTRAQADGDLIAIDPLLLAAAIQGATKELFGEMAERGGETPFADLPDTVFRLLIDHLRK